MSVRVSTGVRLHFGPLAWKGKGPKFGGLGLMVRGENLEQSLSATPADDWSFEGSEQSRARLQPTIDRLRQTDLRPVRWVESPASVPAHCGLGSGTQLACLAVAAAVRANGRELPNAAQLALWTGRGDRSWLGLHGFLGGGLMLDAGQVDRVGVLASRVACPGVVLLATDGPAGLSGPREEAAFAALPPMGAGVTGRLCDLATRHVIAGAAAENFRLFADGLTEFGLLVGEFFHEAQGGRFADATWEDRLRKLREVGPVAVAQSSWGPTVVVICEDEQAADRVRARTPDVAYVKAEAVRPSGSTR